MNSAPSPSRNAHMIAHKMTNMPSTIPLMSMTISIITLTLAAKRNR